MLSSLLSCISWCFLVVLLASSVYGGQDDIDGQPFRAYKQGSFLERRDAEGCYALFSKLPYSQDFSQQETWRESCGISPKQFLMMESVDKFMALLPHRRADTNDLLDIFDWLKDVHVAKDTRQETSISMDLTDEALQDCMDRLSKSDSATNPRVQAALNTLQQCRDNKLGRCSTTVFGLRVETPMVEAQSTYKAVWKLDSLASARILSLLSGDLAGSVLVLNMADSFQPGGGVEWGWTTQEETLCVRSDLWIALLRAQRAGAYPLHRDVVVRPSVFCENYYGHHEALESFCQVALADYEDIKDKCKQSSFRSPNTMLFPDFVGLYSKDVRVLKDFINYSYVPLATPFSVNMVSLPALDIGHMVLKYGMDPAGRGLRRWFSQLEYVLSTMERVRAILQAAVINKDQHLVLGAFGCGAFNNDARFISAVFHHYLGQPEFSRAFKSVIFSILVNNDRDAYNFNEFSKNFKDFTPKKYWPALISFHAEHCRTRQSNDPVDANDAVTAEISRILANINDTT